MSYWRMIAGPSILGADARAWRGRSAACRPMRRRNRPGRPSMQRLGERRRRPCPAALRSTGGVAPRGDHAQRDQLDRHMKAHAIEPLVHGVEILERLGPPRPIRRPASAGTGDRRPRSPAARSADRASSRSRGRPAATSCSSSQAFAFSPSVAKRDHTSAGSSPLVERMIGLHELVLELGLEKAQRDRARRGSAAPAPDSSRAVRPTRWHAAARRRRRRRCRNRADRARAER